MTSIRASLSDSQLLQSIRTHAERERTAGLAVIHDLREVRRRRLDAKLGYSSLHKFCMEELKYSSGSAWRRIQAMDALDEIPSLERKVADGKLTLSSVSQVQSFCAQKGKSAPEKHAIFAQVESLSKREAERVLASIAPLPQRPEKLRAVDASLTELRVTLDAATIENLDQIKAWISHSGAGYAAVISKLAELGLKHLDPARKVRCEKPASPPAEVERTRAESVSTPRPRESRAHDSQAHPSSPAPSTQTANSPTQLLANPAQSQAIPAQTRREVWRRDQGRCTYAHPATGRRCDTRALLQIDHVIPRARGGGHELSNLRLRCRAHNLLSAVEVYGTQKMGEYLRS